MRTRAAILSFTLVAVALTVLPAGASAKSCPSFTVGKANSSSYSDGKLPARKVFAERVTCKRVRGLARAFHRGDIEIPDGTRGLGEWGSGFDAYHGGIDWTCRLWWIGGSGPTYKFSCRDGSRRARWAVG